MPPSPVLGGTRQPNYLLTAVGGGVCPGLWGLGSRVNGFGFVAA